MKCRDSPWSQSWDPNFSLHWQGQPPGYSLAVWKLLIPQLCSTGWSLFSMEVPCLPPILTSCSSAVSQGLVAEVHWGVKPVIKSSPGRQGLNSSLNHCAITWKGENLKNWHMHTQEKIYANFWVWERGAVGSCSLRMCQNGWGSGWFKTYSWYYLLLGYCCLAAGNLPFCGPVTPKPDASLPGCPCRLFSVNCPDAGCSRQRVCPGEQLEFS